MSEEWNSAEMLRNALYSFEVWSPAIKIVICFAIAAVLLFLFKVLIKALYRFIQRIKH